LIIKTKNIVKSDGRMLKVTGSVDYNFSDNK